MKVYDAPVLEYGAVHVFTDGSCYPNPGPGGWGFVVLDGLNSFEAKGGAVRTTNNEMELQAINQALKALVPCNRKIIIYTDSQYAQRAVMVWAAGWAREGWTTRTGKPVANVCLIREICARLLGDIDVRWVKGHHGFQNNERADVLAGEARLELLRRPLCLRRPKISGKTAN